MKKMYCICFNLIWIKIFFVGAVRIDTLPHFKHFEAENKNGSSNLATKIMDKREIRPDVIRPTSSFLLDYIRNPNSYGTQPNVLNRQNNFGQNSLDYMRNPNSYGNQPNIPNRQNNFRQYPNGDIRSNSNLPQTAVHPPVQTNGFIPREKLPFYNVENRNSFSRTNPDDKCSVLTQDDDLFPNPQTLCCGRDASLTHSVTGETETELDQFPWIVSLKVLFNNGNIMSVYNCGGSLISRQYVLTAAHCVVQNGATLIGVNVTFAESDVLMFSEEVILHAQYDSAELHNDIAVIRLKGHAPYTRYIRPICLPPSDTGEQLLSNHPLVLGGRRRNGRHINGGKQSSTVRLVYHDDCTDYFPYVVSKTHLCAIGQDLYEGDSGGPLMMLLSGSYYIVGIASSKRADRPSGKAVPSFYTNVPLYISWIRNNARY